MGDKIVYVLGYDNKARWKKALGGQYGCLYIDEINIADMEYVREAAMRCDYLLATLNPDDPSLPVYGEYINHARPLPEWKDETPKEILEQLNEDEKPGWIHWFFHSSITPGCRSKRKIRLSRTFPKAPSSTRTRYWDCAADQQGLVFNLEPRHMIPAAQARDYVYVQFSAGVDTSYSQQSPDTFAFVFTGITADRRKITLAVEEHNNRDRAIPITPSDVPPLLIQFLDRNRQKWGFARMVYIDNADHATILECQKYARQHGSVYSFQPAWKKTTLIDRINLQAGWMAHGDYLIVSDACGPWSRSWAYIPGGRIRTTHRRTVTITVSTRISIAGCRIRTG